MFARIVSWLLRIVLDNLLLLYEKSLSDERKHFASLFPTFLSIVSN